MSPISTFHLLFIAISVLAVRTGFASINVAGPTTDWVAITYPNTQSDYLNDEQTGINEYDIVGLNDGVHHGVYTQFFNGGDDTSLTDGEIAFRFRLSANKSPSYYEGYAWVGMDVDGDSALDLFVGVENPSATSWTISIHDAGTGANDAPNTTTINANSIYESSSIAGDIDWAPVSLANDPVATNFDLDSKDPDYFLSFKLDFSALVTAVNTLLPGTNFDDTTSVAYVTATSTQGNSLNADLSGVNADLNSTQTWEQLKAISPELNVAGEVVLVPEPAYYSFVLGVIAVALGTCRRPCKCK